MAKENLFFLGKYCTTNTKQDIDSHLVYTMPIVFLLSRLCHLSIKVYYTPSVDMHVMDKTKRNLHEYSNRIHSNTKSLLTAPNRQCFVYIKHRLHPFSLQASFLVLNLYLHWPIFLAQFFEARLCILNFIRPKSCLKKRRQKDNTMKGRRS